MVHQLRSTVYIVKQRRPAQPAKECLRIPACMGPLRRVLQGYVGMRGERASQQCGLAGTPWTLQEDWFAGKRRPAQGNCQGSVNDEIKSLKNDITYAMFKDMVICGSSY